MKITFSSDIAFSKNAIVTFVDSNKKMMASTVGVDKKIGGAIKRGLGLDRFSGKQGETIELMVPHKDVNRVIVVGLGDLKELTTNKIEDIGGKVIAMLLASGEKAISVACESVKESKISQEAFAAHMAAGMRIRSYRFDKYRTKEAAHKKPSVKSVDLVCGSPKDAKSTFAPLDAVVDGIFLTRDLISEPGNVIQPESYAKFIKTMEKDGLKVKIMGEAALKKLGMGALLAVGQGSAKESHVCILEWNGNKKKAKDKPLALIGKGVTFDSGGISLKPGEGMEEMKWDMGGSGIVVGTMRALARRKAKVNVVAIVGLVENMPSGTAQRPGDVITSLSGQTIEVINTDAEGRLVLADILWYCQDVYKPKAMIDFATLTGAIIISLGKDQYSGYFTDDETLSKQLYDAGIASGDKTWRMPLSNEYDQIIDSDIADMRNASGRAAGSITAAQFLKRHTNGVPWAHVDVAGVVWSAKNTNKWEKGATGYGVRLMDRFIADNYED